MSARLKLRRSVGEIVSNWLSDWIYAKTHVAIDLSEIRSDEAAQALATTALAAAASVDGEYSESEASEIVSILTHEYGQAATAAVENLEEAVQHLAASGDVDALFAEIRTRMQLPHREQLFALLIRVVGADSRRAGSEWRFLDRAAKQLGLSDNAVTRGFAAARNR
jgi:uncharacterized tellurite resistance protein B-like protein